MTGDATIDMLPEGKWKINYYIFNKKIIAVNTPYLDYDVNSLIFSKITISASNRTYYDSAFLSMHPAPPDDDWCWLWIGIPAHPSPGFTFFPPLFSHLLFCLVRCSRTRSARKLSNPREWIVLLSSRLTRGPKGKVQRWTNKLRP